MKKVFLGVFGVLVVAVALLFFFRQPLFEIMAEQMTQDMFVASDTDGFDPGLPVGAQFPSIEVHYKGATLSDVSPFIADKGMVFIANRSADW